jgi:hypothetical protein
LDNPAGYPLSSTEYEYFNWSRNAPGAQLTNGSVGASFSANYINGDGLYLQDPLGNIRNSMTNPCTSAAMCETPAWVTEILNRSGQIIPIPVALNKVANATRDRYNPVVSIASGATTSALRTTLTNQGFTVNASVGDAIDSALAAGTPVGISTSTNGTNLVGTRVAIADLAGTTRTTVWIREASGYNAMPNVVGLTASAARAALIAAGFTGTSVTGDDALIVSAQSVVAGTRTQLATQVTLTAP